MKKNIIYSIISAGALMIGLTSCHDDPQIGPATSDLTGAVQLSSMSIDMSDAEKVIHSTAGRATIDLNDFIVAITPKEDGAATRTYRFGDMPEVLTLPVGEYSIEVESHKVQKAEWDAPYYKGSKDFTITDGEITNIGTVTAKFASLKVTVIFNDDLRKVMGDDVTVTITANEEGLLTYTPAETRAGFFEVVEGSTTLIAHFEGTIDGMKTVQDTPFTDIEAGQHRIITYKTKAGPSIPEQTGTIDPNGGITLDATVETVDVAGNVTVDEDLLDSSDRPGQEEQPEEPEPGPGGDEPSEDPAATFEAFNSPKLNLNGVNDPANFDGENVIVKIHCPKGIKNLVVNIVTDNDEFENTLGQVNMPMTFDLAYPGEDEAALQSLGLATGADVIGKTEVEFNISQFVPLLAPFKGNHNFVLSVTDNDNMCETMTLKFKSN